jgi:hypothetical protein
MAHNYNPSYSGDRDLKDVVRSQPKQIVLETLSGWLGEEITHKKGLVEWHISHSRGYMQISPGVVTQVFLWEK